MSKKRWFAGHRRPEAKSARKGLKIMKHSHHSKMIEDAIKTNPACEIGIMNNCSAFYTPSGPSGQSELLALLYAGERSGGGWQGEYWYGYIGCPMGRADICVALLAWATLYINAPSNDLLFERFHYWMRQGKFHPCTVTRCDEAYAEAATFDEAVILLAAMIKGFDSRRLGAGGNTIPEANEFPETRIFNVFTYISEGKSQTPL